MLNVKELTKKLIDFSNARDWDKYHTGPELAKSLMIEAAELNRIFQWGQDWQVIDLENLKEEIADCLIYLMYLADKTGIEITDNLILEKMKKNAVKYPAKEGKWLKTK